jgi:hypothetical protein
MALARVASEGALLGEGTSISKEELPLRVYRINFVLFEGTDNRCIFEFNYYYVVAVTLDAVSRCAEASTIVSSYPLCAGLNTATFPRNVTEMSCDAWDHITVGCIGASIDAAGIAIYWLEHPQRIHGVSHGRSKREEEERRQKRLNV